MWELYFQSLGVMLLLGFLTWIYSAIKQNVHIVDSLWSLMFLAGGLYVYLATHGMTTGTTGKSLLVLALLSLWALRLSVFLTIRNWGKPEDRRYQEIRKNNEPNFTFKSIYIVFGLQAVLAWLIFIGLLPLLHLDPAFHWLDWVAVAMWATGFLFEAIGDRQLYAFKKQKDGNEVLNTGLWRYTRHPNYFGEFLIWWAFFLMAVTSGAWYVIVAPLIMTILLFKVSGVGMMEKNITSRRPGYKEYIERTNTFFPWFPKSSAINAEGQQS